MTRDKQGEVGDRLITFRMSDESVDRDRDIIKADGWKLDNFRKNPVFLQMHGHGEYPIGRFERVWTADKELMGTVRFADEGTSPAADLAYQLYKQGIMNAVSVSFSAEKDDYEENDHGGYTYASQELLECSAVPVPSNQNALAVAKGFDKTTRDLFIKETAQSDGAEETPYDAEADGSEAEPYEDITDESLERITKILGGQNHG